MFLFGKGFGWLHIVWDTSSFWSYWSPGFGQPGKTQRSGISTSRFVNLQVQCHLLQRGTHSSITQVPWRQFLVNLCAVVGGCFAKLDRSQFLLYQLHPETLTLWYPGNWNGFSSKRNWLFQPRHFQSLFGYPEFVQGNFALKRLGGGERFNWRLGGGVYSSTGQKQIWSYLYAVLQQEMWIFWKVGLITTEDEQHAAENRGCNHGIAKKIREMCAWIFLWGLVKTQMTFFDTCKFAACWAIGSVWRSLINNNKISSSYTTDTIACLIPRLLCLPSVADDPYQKYTITMNVRGWCWWYGCFKGPFHLTSPESMLC